MTCFGGRGGGHHQCGVPVTEICLSGLPCLTVVRRLGRGGRLWRLGEGPRGAAGHEYGPGADDGSRVVGTLMGPRCGPWSDV